MDETWARQKADLEARLKKGFACASSDLLWCKFTPATEARGPISVPPQSPSLSPLGNSIPFIAKLEFEPISLQDFPQRPCFDALMRASIYLIDTVRSGLILCETHLTDLAKIRRDTSYRYQCAVLTKGKPMRANWRKSL
jgi:hypothetical protein